MRCLLVFACVLLPAHLLLIQGQSHLLRDELVAGGVGGRGMRLRVSRMLRDRLGRRSKEVCYDLLGCFPVDRPLKKGPQDPRDVDTRFFLFTREKESAEEITYADGRDSLVASTFDAKRTTRFLVHGFKGSSKDSAARGTVKKLLDREDCNVILLDWEKGASGPSYRLSAANTQLVGRQLELMLLDLISLGTHPSSIHVIGFSLGAHIAGFAGRSLGQRGIKIGRITGLDPASPLFRENFSTSLQALSKEDAALVDVLHTDGAILLTEGFGLLKALGHVDFFPNGGHDQPGCEYIFASVLVSHLEGTVNSSTICNHVRGLQLFLESISQAGGDACQFRAFPCTSREHFRSGTCFPNNCQLNSTDGSCGLMGYNADSWLARGPLYLVTRDQAPFCGDQLQSIVVLSRIGQKPRGHLALVLKANEDVTVFKLHNDPREVSPGYTYRALSAAKFNTFNSSLQNLTASVILKPAARKLGELFVLESLRVNGLDGDHWNYCGKRVNLEPKEEFEMISVELVLGSC